MRVHASACEHARRLRSATRAGSQVTAPHVPPASRLRMVVLVVRTALGSMVRSEGFIAFGPPRQRAQWSARLPAASLVSSISTPRTPRSPRTKLQAPHLLSLYSAGPAGLSASAGHADGSLMARMRLAFVLRWLADARRCALR